MWKGSWHWRRANLSALPTYMTALVAAILSLLSSCSSNLIRWLGSFRNVVGARSVVQGHNLLRADS